MALLPTSKYRQNKLDIYMDHYHKYHSFLCFYVVVGGIDAHIFFETEKKGMINFVYCFDQGVVFILTTFEATSIESGIFNSFFIQEN